MDGSNVARFIRLEYIDTTEDGSKRVQSRGFGGSQDNQRCKVSVDTDMLIKFIRTTLDTILLQLKLDPKDHAFAILNVKAIRNAVDPSKFDLKSPLDVIHSPLPNRCSHADIAWQTKTNDVLSTHKYKKLRKELAKIVIGII